MNNNPKQMIIHRREFLNGSLKMLGGACLGGLLPFCGISYGSVAESDSREYDLLIPRVKYERQYGTEQWNIHPAGEQNLLREFSRMFNCRVKRQKAYRRWGKANEFNAIVDFETFPGSGMYPFVFMTGQLPFRFSQKARQNLVDYLNRGGFILMDDCVYQHSEDLFYQCGYDLLAELFGSNFIELGKDHEIFGNVFDMKDGLPMVQGVANPVMGVVINGRVCAFLSSTDLHCGWIGRFFAEGEKFRESIKMGINILYYAMTS